MDTDLDVDGLPDGWERVHGLSEFVHNASADFDLDGLNDLQNFNGEPVRFDPIRMGMIIRQCGSSFSFNQSVIHRYRRGWLRQRGGCPGDQSIG